MAKFSDIKARYEHDGELGADSIEWLLKRVNDLNLESQHYFDRLNEQDLLDQEDFEIRESLRVK